MASLRSVIEDLLAKIEADTSITFARVWNNQFALQEDGQIYSFPFPCCFIEIVNPDHNQLGLGFTQSDLIIRFHIGQTYYNDPNNGTIEQNLTIFDLRDELVSAFTYYEPVLCSGLMKVHEEQDFEHTNVYHYILDFKCSFVDTVGDTTTTQVIKPAPTDLTVNAEFDVTYMHKK